MEAQVPLSTSDMSFEASQPSISQLRVNIPENIILRNPDSSASPLEPSLPVTSPMASSSPSAVTTRSKFEKLVKGYYHQLTRGCGRDSCPNPFCKCSSSPSYDLSKAAQVSIDLAKKSIKDVPEFFFCTEESESGAKTPVSNWFKAPLTPAVVHAEIPSIHFPTLVMLVESCKAIDDWTPLHDLISEVFSSPASLSRSFLRRGAEGENVILDPESTGLEMEAVNESYRLLLDDEYTKVDDLQQTIQQTLITSLENLVQRLHKEASSITQQNAHVTLRPFLILLECPLLLEPMTHQTIVLPLCRAFTALSKTSQSTLVLWLSHYTSDRFSRLVSIFQHFITVQLLSLMYVDERIMQATLVLDLLYRTNEYAASRDGESKRLVPFVDFYNDSVNSLIDLQQDYWRWIKSKQIQQQQLASSPSASSSSSPSSSSSFSAFSFCNYPFILDPASKSKVLQIDASQQQGQELNSAFLQYALFARATSPYLVLRVKRSALLQTTLSELTKVTDVNDLKKPLKVQFIGEEGLDEGGVRKEFFSLVVREILNPDYAMFSENETSRLMWFNSQSFESENEYRSLGIVLGLAIYNSILLEARFPLAVYKKLYGHSYEPSLNDLEELDPTVGKSLRHLLENVHTAEEMEAMCLTFSITEDVYGTTVVHDLKPNGREETVALETKQEYVKRYVKWILVDSVEKQFKAFQMGFLVVAGGACLKLFRPEELEQLVCGSPSVDLNFDDLERGCKYEDGYTKDSKVVKDLWIVLKALSPENKRRFLAFTTGSDRVPLKGLSSLGLTIHRAGADSDRLVSAHTCFNTLMVPEYSSREKLKVKIETAISNSEGFGLR